MWNAVLVTVLEVSAVLFVWYKHKVPFEQDVSNYKKAGLTAAVFVITISFNLLMLKKNYDISVQFNLFDVYTLLCMIGMIDFKTHRIPNKLLFAGITIRTALLVLDAVMRSDAFRQQLFLSFAGLAFGLGVMLLLSLLTRHGIGYGDVKLFGWLGYSLGLMDTYNILFYSVLYAALTGGYLMAVKKHGRKTKIPFAPFIFFGMYSVFVMQFLS